MNCLVTAGPTFEPLDKVRRLTNFSSGRLGSELAKYLAAKGHRVTLLFGEQATYRGEPRADVLIPFTTSQDLREHLEHLSSPKVGAVFHAAAVSDFAFGQVWRKMPNGQLRPVKKGKLSTRQGALLAELKPTPKIIAELRGWFPQARLVGWKYEVDGDREAALKAARSQLAECLTDACVANGPAYGEGFGLVEAAAKSARHLAGPDPLFEALELSLSAAPD